MNKTILLSLIFLFMANIGFAQNEDFDRQLRQRFPDAGIPTDRKFEINNFYPANKATNVYVLGKFMFIIYEEDGVHLSNKDKEIFLTCCKQAVNIYNECIEIPYTIPIFVLFGVDNGCYASSLTSDNMQEVDGNTTISKILRGDNDSFLQLWINSNLDMFITDILNDGYYTLKQGEGDSYLPTVIVHEIFHGLAQSYNLLENHIKYYGTPCEQEGHNTPKQHTHPTRTKSCYSELYYNGPNAVKANGGFPVQTEQMHLCLEHNLIEAASANSLIDINKVYIWNHIGPVSLGLLQDVGYHAKKEYLNSEYIQPYYGKPSWTILDKNGDYYGRIVLGKIQGLAPDCQEKYENNELIETDKLRPYLEPRFYPTENILIDKNKIKVFGSNKQINIQNINNAFVQIFNFNGKIVKQINKANDNLSITVSPGLYIVKVNDDTFKINCL